MIELIAIGTELLEGSTVDTNAAFIGKRLLQSGFTVARKETVSDDKEVLRATLENALERSRIVLTTGGLGPTFDDLTLSIAADLFGAELVHSDEVEADLRKRFGNHKTIPQQSMVPKGAKVFLNGRGTAPCCVLEKEGKSLILLPGVPYEMRFFMETYIASYIESRLVGEKKIHLRSAFLFDYTESVVDPVLRDLQKRFPSVGMGVYPGLGTLGLSFRSQDGEKVLEELLTEIATIYPIDLYAYNERPIEKALHSEITRQKKSLSLAESCTGGMIAARICQIPSASNYFLGSIVSYANAVKENVLQVRSLETCGAVSEEVAREMAEGALKLSGSDLSISVTGIAGPDGGTPEKPVGTVWAAIAEKGGKTFAGQIGIKGGKSRESIIEYTVTYVIGSLWRYLRHGKEPFK